MFCAFLVIKALHYMYMYMYYLLNYMYMYTTDLASQIHYTGRCKNNRTKSLLVDHFH